MSSPNPDSNNNNNSHKRKADEYIESTRRRDAAITSIVNMLQLQNQVLNTLEDNRERETKRRRTQQQIQEEQWMYFLIGFAVCFAMMTRSARSRSSQQGPKNKSV